MIRRSLMSRLSRCPRGWSIRPRKGGRILGSYVGVAYQGAGEATISFNHQGGHGVGAAAGIELFLQDLMAPLFDKPVLSKF
jgi:hypothetical protein